MIRSSNSASGAAPTTQADLEAKSTAVASLAGVGDGSAGDATTKTDWTMNRISRKNSTQVEKKNASGKIEPKGVSERRAICMTS